MITHDYLLHSVTKKLEWFKISTVIDEWKIERNYVVFGWDVEFGATCRGVKPVDFVSQFGLSEFDVELVKVDKTCQILSGSHMVNLGMHCKVSRDMHCVLNYITIRFL